MNDLLSELDCIDGDGGPSSMQQDGSSSPLRPNPKYCAILKAPARPAAAAAAAPRPAPLSGANLTPISGGAPRQTHWENVQGSATTPIARIPETVQKIMAAAEIGSGMEVDDDAQISDRSSSPLKPNEKYCSIVTPPSRPSRVVARVAPQPAAAQQPMRPVQPVHRDTVGISENEVHRGRTRSISPHHHRNPGVPDRTRVAPPHYSNPMHPMGPAPVGHYGPGRPPPYPHYGIPYGPGVYSNPFGPGGYLPYAANYNQPYHGPDYGRPPSHVKEEFRDEIRDLPSAPVRPKDKSEWKKGRDAEEEKRRLSNERRHEKERKKRIEEEKEQRWRKAEEEERSRRERAGKDKRQSDSERRARSQLKSFSGAQPKREVSTVSMTREELEELKAKCMAEGEQKALADARKAEAIGRLESCLQKVEDGKNEPEPMEVEESDMVESSIPTSSSNTVIVPIPLIIKSEPHEEENEPRADNRKQEIPQPTEVVKKEADDKEGKERTRKGEDEGDRVVKKEVDDEIEIIENPPAEVVPVSDDEGTVTADSLSKERKEEGPSASKPVVEEEELWVIATKRGRKKNTVFDLSKVKKEKEDESGRKVRDSSEPIIPFNASRVKPEPADIRTSGATGVLSDTIPHSGKVKTEAVDDGPRRDTVAGSTVDAVPATVPEDTVAVPVTVALILARSPSQPLPDFNDEEQPRPLQQLQPIGEEEGGEVQPRPVQHLQPIVEEGSDVEAALTAARRLIRQIGETVHSQHQQPQQQPQRPVRQSRPPRQVHQPSAGSFLHSLRTASRKRRLCCDEDEGEWIAKRVRIEEEVEE